jgi:predicted GIY-YIG superfamily endonuclease
MLLRDRLIARMAAMGEPVDYPRLVAEVLGIRGAPPELARRLVAQALVIEDRRESWQRVGVRICRDAPSTPGVYVFRDSGGQALYVGKAVNLRRRLRSHFAARRWPRLKAAMARVAAVQWQEVGSELEALVREATMICQLRPVANVQVGPPALATRMIAGTLIRDVVTILPSVDPGSVELVAARADGAVLIQRTSRSGVDLDQTSPLVWAFFRPPAAGGAATGNEAGPSLAALVFSWLARRGASTTRLDPHGWGSEMEFRTRIATLLRDDQLFVERLVIA